VYQRIWLEVAREPILRVLVCVLMAVLTFRQWVWSPVTIAGPSMLPTWSNGQIAGINKVAYLFASPRRGDIVFVCTGSELLVKRIVGLPGEEVSARDGIFYVNATPLHETYVQFAGSWSIAAGKLGPERFVVAGDNRSQTLISVVRRDRIVGRLTPFL
jgi:signal peptidase I